MEISRFSEMHAKALESLNKGSEGLSSLFNAMKSKIFSSDSKNLEFMNSVLDQVAEIRKQVSFMHDYVSILEYNDKALRDSLNSFNFLNGNRTQSAHRSKLFEHPENCGPRRYAKTLILNANSMKNSMDSNTESLQYKIKKT